MCPRLLRCMRGTGPRATGIGDAFFFVALRGTGPRVTGTEAFFFVGRGLSPAVPSPRLKQDVQDEQDEQDVQDAQDERQVREDLNVYRIAAGTRC